MLYLIVHYRTYETFSYTVITCTFGLNYPSCHLVHQNWMLKSLAGVRNELVNKNVLQSGGTTGQQIWGVQIYNIWFLYFLSWPQTGRTFRKDNISGFEPGPPPGEHWYFCKSTTKNFLYLYFPSYIPIFQGSLFQKMSISLFVESHNLLCQS